MAALIKEDVGEQYPIKPHTKRRSETQAPTIDTSTEDASKVVYCGSNEMNAKKKRRRNSKIYNSNSNSSNDTSNDTIRIVPLDYLQTGLSGSKIKDEPSDDPQQSEPLTIICNNNSSSTSCSGEHGEHDEPMDTDVPMKEESSQSPAFVIHSVMSVNNC